MSVTSVAHLLTYPFKNIEKKNSSEPQEPSQPLTLTRLPSELLVKIFLFTIKEMSDFYTHSLSNYAFYKAARNPLIITRLFQQMPHAKAVAFLHHYAAEAKDLSLSFSPFTIGDLHKDLVDEELIQICQRITDITSLDLRGCANITSAALESMTALSRLKRLQLLLRFQEGMHFEKIARLTSITELAYGGMHHPSIQVPKEEFNHLTGLIQLRSLDLSCNDGNLIHAENIGVLRQLSSLTALSLNYANFDANALQSLPPCTNISSLAFTGIRDDHLLVVAQCLHLTALHFFYDRFSHLTNQGLTSLIQLTGLQQLGFDTSKRFTDAGLACVISHLTHLTSLQVDQWRENGNERYQTIAPFALATQISQLSVSGGLINDVNLCILEILPKLRGLELVGCHQISLSRVKVLLQRATQLKHLTVIDAHHRYSVEAVKEVLATYPGRVDIRNR